MDSFESWLAAGSSDSRLGVSLTQSTASDLFLHLHFMAKSLKEKKRVLFVSTRLVELNFRIMCSKLAIRWDATLVKIVEVGGCLDDVPLSDDGTLATQALFTAIREAASDVSVVMFEDVGIFGRLGVHNDSVMDMIEELSEKEGIERVLASFSSPSALYEMVVGMSDWDVVVDPVGGGFGKDVTGTMSLRRHSGVSLLPERSRLLFLTGERTMKTFPPGNASIFF